MILIVCSSMQSAIVSQVSNKFNFVRLITHSDCLKEIDLEHNLIGDLGGRELLEALMDRKEGEKSQKYV